MNMEIRKSDSIELIVDDLISRDHGDSVEFAHVMRLKKKKKRNEGLIKSVLKSDNKDRAYLCLFARPFDYTRITVPSFMINACCRNRQPFNVHYIIDALRFKLVAL